MSEELPKVKRAFKGIWIPAWVWLDRRLTATEKVLLAEIDSFTSREQAYFKANDTIATDLGCSTSTAKRAVAKLVRLELVERTTFDGRRRGLRSNIDPLDRAYWTDSQTEKPHLPDQNDPSDGANGTRSNTDKKTKKRTIKRQDPVTMPWEGFEDTWQRWKEYKQTEHRFQFKSNASEQAALHHLAKISNHDSRQATDIINTSIANGWKGLFPARAGNTTAPTTEDRAVFEAYLRTGSFPDDTGGGVG